MMSLLPIFQWLAHTPYAAWLRDSKWVFAVIEMVHLLALAAFGGAVLLVNLGAFGIGLRRHPGEIARQLSPIFFGSLAMMVVSGVFLVAAESLKCYYHPAFRLKMVLFAIAVVFTLTVHRRSLQSPESESKLLAALSLGLWLGVGLAGRAIGFL
jgi:putative copper export protein